MVSDPLEKIGPLLKAVILVLLVGVIVSLFSGLIFLFKDSDRQDSKRTLYALGVRITLAAALLLTVFYGLYTGQLRMGSNAPWYDRTRAPDSAAQDPASAAPTVPDGAEATPERDR